MKESLFMQDSWHSNHGYEAMLDFQMSWLMRLAAEKTIGGFYLFTFGPSKQTEPINLPDNRSIIISRFLASA